MAHMTQCEKFQQTQRPLNAFKYTDAAHNNCQLSRHEVKTTREIRECPHRNKADILVSARGVLKCVLN